MLGTSVVAADGAAGDRYRPAASTGGERISHTSEVVVHCAVGDRERAAAVVDAPAIANSKLVVAVERAVTAHAAVHQRHGRRAAIIVDASSSRNGMVAADTAIENCQSGAAAATIAIDRTAIGSAVGR